MGGCDFFRRCVECWIRSSRRRKNVRFKSDHIAERYGTARGRTVLCVGRSYPQDLDYLKERYGLRYDTERYIVHYKSLGSNLLPEISVFYIED